MKKLIATLLLFFPLLALAQKESPTIVPMDSTTNLITYQEVVRVEGVAKNDLYVRAKEWFAKTFNSANEVIQLDDKESGKVIGKGLSSAIYSSGLIVQGYYLHYTVSITAKDDRYRYEISSFKTEGKPGTVTYGQKTPAEIYIPNLARGKGAAYKGAVIFLTEIKKTGEQLSASIKAAMQNPSKGTKSKDDF